MRFRVEFNEYLGWSPPSLATDDVVEAYETAIDHGADLVDQATGEILVSKGAPTEVLTFQLLLAAARKEKETRTQEGA